MTKGGLDSLENEEPLTSRNMMTSAPVSQGDSGLFIASSTALTRHGTDNTASICDDCFDLQILRPGEPGLAL
jgi:hypothetical protein